MALDDVVQVQCPYCMEQLEVVVEPDDAGRMVQDCDVCCRPWEMSVERDDDGNPHVMVTRAQ